MNLKRTNVEEGYTLDVVVSRQELLMDVRDKLLFEPEYAGNVRDKVPRRSPLRGNAGSWFTGALCLFQEQCLGNKTGVEICFNTYFSMARQNAPLPAIEMTKWFDTNYHFIVPELGPEVNFSCSHKAVNEYKTAKAV